jgi:hypothetical protein
MASPAVDDDESGHAGQKSTILTISQGTDSAARPSGGKGGAGGDAAKRATAAEALYR